MQFSGPGRVRVGTLDIAEGRQGIRQTLRVMSQLVRRYKFDPVVLLRAREIVGPLYQKDYYGEARALHAFVRDDIRYVKDPVGVETISTPDQLLRMGQGDCDDKATLLAAMLESLGHSTRFVAVGFAPGDYSHVFVQVRAGAGWLNLETTEPVGVGWGPRGAAAVMLQDN